MRILWLILGGTALILGAIGLVLPVMPTVPFLLVATYAFARSSKRLHRWILAHPLYGPPIRDWQEHGRIGRRVKVVACLSMAAGLAIAAAIGLPLWLIGAQGGVMTAVAAYLVTRPE